MPPDRRRACEAIVNQQYSVVVLNCLQSRGRVRYRPPLTVDDQTFAQWRKAIYDWETVAQRTELGQRDRIGCISIPSRVNENRSVAVNPRETRKIAVPVRRKTAWIETRREIPQHQLLRRGHSEPAVFEL